MRGGGSSSDDDVSSSGLISFSRSMAAEMKRRMPEHAALLIAHARAPEEAWAVARDCVEAGLDGIDLNADEAIVTPELVEWLKVRGKLTVRGPDGFTQLYYLQGE